MPNNSYGRFAYVEPNDLNNTGIGNTIPFPYEDYCISVGLEIEMMDRYAYGSSSNGKKFKFSSDDGTISFFGGSGADNDKQGFLTTEFTNISANEDEMKECLGIENISIQYNSWMYPTVNIKFVDVRGASLFMPQEKTMQDENNPESFFKALFTFPYPLFKLSVKGFYGKEVTYQLTITKFSSDFNCESGNFEANVEFIGYMYGVYADTPMSLLSIAPYVDNKNYWNTQVQNGRFAFKNGTDGESTESVGMITFPELMAAISTASANATKESSQSETGTRLTNDRGKKEKLESLLSRFLPYSGLTGPWEPNGEIYWKPFNENTSTPIENYELGKALRDWLDEVKDFDNDLYKNTSRIENILEKNKKGDVFAYPRYKFYKVIIENTSIIKGAVISYTNGILGETILTSEETKRYLCDFPKLEESLTTIPTYVFYCESSFKSAAEEKLRALNSSVNQLEGNLHKETFNLIRHFLGFDLSIQNVFNLIFAHYETFIHHYYECLKNIEREGTDRNINNFKDFDETDVNTKKHNGIIPPFAGFYTEDYSSGAKEKVLTIPKYTKSDTEEMTEITFVNSLINAAKLYSEADKLAQEQAQQQIETFSTTLSQLSTDVTSFIPVTLSDYIQNKDGYNPYSEILSLNDDARSAELLMTIFYIRAYYFIQMFGITYMDTFIKIEAENFKRANPSISDKFKQAIKALHSERGGLDVIMNKDASNQRIWQLTSDCNPVLETKFGGYLTSKWLKVINGGVTQYAYPIGNYSVSKIKSDIANGNINKENSDYVLIDGKEISNEEGFIIQENTNFIENIKQSFRDNKDEVGYSAYKELVDNTIGTPQSIINAKRDVCYRLNKNSKEITSNIFYSYDSENNFEAKTFSEAQKGGCTRIGCYQKGKGETGTFNTVKNGTYDSGWTIFNEEIYKFQNDIYAKAYLFLFAVPINDSYLDSVESTDNCIVNKSALLREGAYYFMLTADVFDPETWNEWKKWNYKNGEIPLTSKDSTLNYLMAENTIDKYIKWPYERKNDLRRNKKVIEYFKEWAETDFRQIDLQFKENTKEFNTLIYNFYVSQVYIMDPYIPTNNLSKDFGVATYKPYGNKFIRKIQSYCDIVKSATTTSNTDIILSDSFRTSKDLKLSLYMTLKNLYDKWYCSRDKETWELGNTSSDFENFEYLDSFYNNIGHNFMINGTHLNEIISSIVPSITAMKNYVKTDYNTMSFYEMLAEICQRNNMILLALPQKFGLDTNPTQKNVEDMFTPWPYKAISEGKTVKNSYICLYAYRPSEALDISDGGNNDYAYNQDGFTIGDVGTMPLSLSELNGDTIPAFGVSFARQNQSLFKKISLSTATAQETELSIATTFDITSEAKESPRKTTLYGQDMYRVYSNYAYQCGVDMMGNAQVMPMMYFQLNNIPLWHGAYMIIKVEHQIGANNMSTTFTGVRQSRFAVPLVNGAVYFVDTDGNVQRYGGLYEGSPSLSPEELEKLKTEANKAANSTSPSKQAWLQAVEEMGNFYNKNIHSYQGNNHTRTFYDCYLFGNMNQQVGDDCSSFITACLYYYAYKIGKKNLISNTTYTTSNLNTGGTGTKLLKALGFKWIEIPNEIRVKAAKSETKKALNDIAVKGDILTFNEDGKGHTEVYWGVNSKGSMISEAWGNRHDAQIGKTMPCYYCPDPYRYIWRLS